ncbi:cobalamin biosynthesis protein CobW [Phytoactinopolyspora alkaliphila]|uniref:Cobalamin biosynthesis protein CobW n=1 Tax=Phytoactinopolyspora alkaliphila TaxID=1783498 RepID=A0A6N9YL52_9ACTN|nr:cobalamin biosynthesis protein CobW [Phytoactinopolyspora alkaliphila]
MPRQPSSSATRCQTSIPGRLMRSIEQLGTGRVRARGRFWLPTRPQTLCLWDGAGGQSSAA